MSIEERRYVRLWSGDRISCVGLCPAVLNALGYEEQPLSGKIGDGIFVKARKTTADGITEICCFWAREEGDKPGYMLEAKFVGVSATGNHDVAKAVTEVADKISWHLENPEEQLPGYEWDRTSFNEMLIKEAKLDREQEKRKFLNESK